MYRNYQILVSAITETNEEYCSKIRIIPFKVDRPGWWKRLIDFIINFFKGLSK